MRIEPRVRDHDADTDDVTDTSALVELVNFYRVLLGQSCERTRDWEGAIEHYSEGVACEPCGTFTAYFLHNNLGYCLNVVGRYGEAEWYCRTAIRVDGSRANGFKNLGISRAGQGDLAGARGVPAGRPPGAGDGARGVGEEGGGSEMSGMRTGMPTPPPGDLGEEEGD